MVRSGGFPRARPPPSSPARQAPSTTCCCSPGPEQAIAARKDLLEVHRIGGRPEADGRPLYLDESGALHRRYGLTGAGCYLIRPDGYIGFRSAGPSAGALLAFLDRWFSAPSG
jgi:hypothetical protein